MGYSGLFITHTFDFTSSLFNNRCCLHSPLTLLDPILGPGVWDMNVMSVIYIIKIVGLVKKWSLNS